MVAPFLGVVGGSDFVGDSLVSSRAISEAWRQNWTNAFSNENGLYLSINQFASIIAVGAFLFFIVIWTREMVTNGLLPAIDRLSWLILVLILL